MVALCSVVVIVAGTWLGVVGAASLNRTVVFLFKETESGQDLFIRGGIDNAQRPGKFSQPSPVLPTVILSSLCFF